jgi:hypothetical protein
MPSGLFQPDFLIALRGMIAVHHSIYAELPPQGIYFEALVENAFRRVRKPFEIITPSGRNQPTHDLLVEGHRISIKTETGLGTDGEAVNITKLCTTEREPWTSDVLISRVMEHLTRYDLILMLRAIWEGPILHYQLVEIPIDTLRLIRNAELHAVGRRRGRGSLGADIVVEGAVAFHVHFDGSDGKCQVRGLSLRYCEVLEEWDTRVGQ